MAGDKVIDSHIHLYAKSHLDKLSWAGDLPEGHALKQQRSVDDYRVATANFNSKLGFIFVETDRKYEDIKDWTRKLEEVAFLSRIASGNPVTGEGHQSNDRNLLLGVVAWAPMSAGDAVLKRYVAEVQSVCRGSSLVKGFRFLLQDEPRGTMLTDQFLSSLTWLADHDYSFDLTINTHQHGIWQIDEMCEMLTRLQGRNPRIIVSHFAKPDLTVSNSSETFETWKTGIQRISSFPHVWIKLSGLFSEMSTADLPLSDLKDKIQPWIQTALLTLGADRILFGSDWPVCTVELGDRSWQLWYDLVRSTLDELQVSREEQDRIFCQNAIDVYRIDPESSLMSQL